MKLAEANKKINEIANIPFKELFTPAQIANIRINKGKTGQLLELALGMQLSNRNMDFEDGELKTNKCDKNGKSLETVFITQISSIIDDLIDEKTFEKTHLYKKISNILYVPVCKDGDEEDWFFFPSIHIDLSQPKFAHLLDIWRNDYYSICKQLKVHIQTSRDGFIHTSNGQHIQIRSKDSQPYSPIYSNRYGRYISNKNHAFYFKKELMSDIKNLSNWGK